MLSTFGKPLLGGLRRLLPVLLLVAVVLADSVPPGDYSDVGRVVRTTHGSIELFGGNVCSLCLTEELQSVLAPHLGEVVRVDYTRGKWESGMLDDPCGAPITRIRAVKTLAKDLETLPVRITVRAAKPQFTVAEPVQVEVDMVNRTDHPVTLGIGLGDCHLFRDYHLELTLIAPEPEPATPEGPSKPGAALVAGEPPPPPAVPTTGVARVLELPAGGTHRVTVVSDYMARPGRYQVIYAVPGPDEWNYQSPPVEIEVVEPKDEAAELAALRVWLTRAAPEQRVPIAERMIALGDDSGVAEVVRLMDLPRFYGPASIYRFLWKYGGEKVEKRILARLGRAGIQDQALAIVEEIQLSPRAVPLLESLLADRRETGQSTSGWCERPRIADIVAAWLAGYTKDVRFPKNGTVEERDAAVARVLAVLKEDPKHFSVLR